MKTKENLVQSYLLKIRFKTKLIFSQEDIAASFKNIKRRIDLPIEVTLPTTRKTNFFATMPFRVAATIAVLLTVSFLGFNYYNEHQQIIIANASETVKNVNLSDGTIISLRSLSSITYRKNYKENRRIVLKGEAFFNVAKDKTHPFTVETKYGKITVLGTQFSVRSFENETYTKALLQEGSIQFAVNHEKNSVLLKPGEEAKLMGGDATIRVRKVENMDQALAWQSRKFTFDNESLEVILSVISDAFDKTVDIKDKGLAMKRYTLKFNRKESLTKMLNVLSEVAKFNYRIEDDKIFIERQ